MELGIRLSFVKTSEFRGVLKPQTPPRYATDIYLTAIGLTAGGSSTVHIYTQITHKIQGTEHT
jgi:hypothetical protein